MKRKLTTLFPTHTLTQTDLIPKFLSFLSLPTQQLLDISHLLYPDYKTFTKITLKGSDY